MPISIVSNNRFEYHEAGIPSQSSSTAQSQRSHTHSHSATSVTREDIEQAKRQSITLGQPIAIQEDVSESASVSTAMHQMIDGLVDSETSDRPPQARPFPQISHGESPPTPTIDHAESQAKASLTNGLHLKTLTAQDLVNRMQRSPGQSVYASAPNMEREDTLRPPSPSFWTVTPFAPLTGQNSSPKSRPGTAHKVLPDNSTPVPLSSGTAFQQDILRRQQQMQLQSTPIQALASSSWAYLGDSGFDQAPPSERQQSSPWTDSSNRLSSQYLGHEVPRQSPFPAMFGAIGQTPPSGQAG